jgi:hypothetical protein
MAGIQCVTRDRMLSRSDDQSVEQIPARPQPRCAIRTNWVRAFKRFVQK